MVDSQWWCECGYGVMGSMVIDGLTLSPTPLWTIDYGPSTIDDQASNTEDLETNANSKKIFPL